MSLNFAHIDPEALSVALGQRCANLWGPVPSNPVCVNSFVGTATPVLFTSSVLLSVRMASLVV